MASNASAREAAELENNSLESQHDDELETSSAKQDNSNTSTLLGCAIGMSRALYRMHDINTKANVIALNAAIEGARSQTHSENFTLVANQVKRQAQRTEDLAKELKDEIESLESWALKSSRRNE